jgi:hypothetical protein
MRSVNQRLQLAYLASDLCCFKGREAIYAMRGLQV